MENWDGLSYGPLTIDLVEGRLVRFGSIMIGLGKSEFAVLLCLMACQGGAVSRSMLTRGLVNSDNLSLTICRLRKRLVTHFGNLVVIERLRQYGYKLSLSGEFFSFPCKNLCLYSSTSSYIFLVRGTLAASMFRKF